MGFDNGAGDAETQPGAAFAPRFGLGGTVKPLEDLFLFLWRKADPRIRDSQGGPWPLAPERNADLAAGRGVLDPVVDQVQQYPPQLVIIAEDRQVFHPFLAQDDMTGVRKDLCLAANILDQFGEVHGPTVQAQDACIGPGQ